MEPAANLRILVADDSVSTASIFGKILEHRGHSVRVVLNGLAAMDVVRDFKPDAVLLDIGMPGLNGYEVTRQIRREPGLENVAIIIISGHSRDEDRMESAAAGADHHLVKPVDFQKLWTILAETRSVAVRHRKGGQPLRTHEPA